MVLTEDEVREYLADSAENNHLLDGIEFTNLRIDLAMELALSSYNTMPPLTSVPLESFKSKAILLVGTLWHLYNGQMGLAARNQMSYSDGGLTIPIEERFQFFTQMAQMYEQQFRTAAKDMKVSQNIENGWDAVNTDYISFPVW